MNEQLEHAIVAAQHGDLEAFGRVVVQFQRMAYAVAYAMLNDAHLAEDAAQEAFIEAFLNLAKLREPAAFPGWFRRIVLKRSDRLIRGKSLSTAPFELANTHASPTPDLAAQFEARELGQQLQQAINTLPDTDRQLVWLFYLAGYAHAEIGSVLDLSAAVVKKRLFRARQRLRSQLGQTMHAWLPERPSDSAMFALSVQFFIAVRLGDTAQVQRMLAATPALRNAHERWDAATALQHGLPLVSQFTALHRAAYNGDLPLTRLLLDHQADTEGRTSAGHTPLHVAVSSNHGRIVEVLLRAEADPNSATEWGQTPLHFAVMRERPSIAGQLLAAGAHPHAADNHGRTPHDWARLKGNSTLLALLQTPQTKQERWLSMSTHSHQSPTLGEPLLGRSFNAAGQPLDGGAALVISPNSFPTQAAPAPSPFADQQLHSGIKAVDLYAPIVRGGTIAMVAVPGTGMIVQVAELVHAITSQRGGSAVIVELEQPHFSVKDMQAELRNGGVDQHITLLMGNSTDSPELRQQLVLLGIAQAEQLASSGRETLLFVAAPLITPALAERLNARQHTERAAITLFAWHIAEPTASDLSSAANATPLSFDGRIAFSRELASQQIWPANDPLASDSRLLREHKLDSEHERLANAAKALIAAQGGIAGSLASADAGARARKVLLYQSQPFVVAETFTGQPGVTVPLAATLRDLGGILAGNYDHADEAVLRFRGALELGFTRGNG